MATNLIDKIKNKQNNEILIKQCIKDIFFNGSINLSTLEILSYIKIFDYELFKNYENSILLKMGLFFKPAIPKSFNDLIFNIIKDSIKDTTNKYFTPIQNDIIGKINNSKCFSFSSPTSTGKSHIFRYLLDTTDKDVVIIVPSRALINEYYKTIKQHYSENKKINVLTFVDKINIYNSTRNIFIVTPERTRDLFKLKNEFDIAYILFDEAQLSEDKSVRGLYYDSIIRRCCSTFSKSKFVFAYPFIENPEVQYTRNNIDFSDCNSESYSFKNVGQIFYSFDNNGKFYHFGIESEIFGNKAVCDYNPLKKVLDNGGTALIYCSKSKIYNKQIFYEFKDYIFGRKKIENPEALEIIDKFRKLIGASDKESGDYRSTMVNFLKRGIVIHHGSLPLSARTILEEFTQKGFCSLCFATSTLDQGINMPFDLVWIDRFTPSKPLSVKNLVGRAGRSTESCKFDFGQIVIKDSSKTDLRKIIKNDIKLNEISELDILTDVNDDYKEYKEAIKTGEFNEEFNLTNKEMDRIQSNSAKHYIKLIIDNIFDSVGEIKQISVALNDSFYVEIISYFVKIYEIYLNRALTDAENYILTTTIKILFWKIRGKKFSQIVWYRYSYAAKTQERQQIRNNKETNDNLRKIQEQSLSASYITAFQMIPNKKLFPINLTYNQKAYQVDYDRIMVDTYDYIDKLIGFRLGDVFYAAFYKYGEKESNELGTKMSNYIKYGTNNDREIWILRYGFDFEDMDWLYSNIDLINEQGIKLIDNANLTEEQYNKLKNFIIE